MAYREMNTSPKVQDNKVAGTVNAKPIVKGVTKKEKNLKSKMFQAIFADDLENVIAKAKEDAFTTVTESVKDILYGVCIDTLARIFNINESHRRPRSGNNTPYNDMYRKNRQEPSPVIEQDSRDIRYDEILYESAPDAWEVIESMRDALEQFKRVSIADVFCWSSMNEPNYPCRQHGWRGGLNNLQVKRVSTYDGTYYKIVGYPRPEPLN